MNQDIIFIEELCVPASIGVFDWEKDIRQDLFFDIEIRYAFDRASQTDDIQDTVSYADVSKHVIDVVNRRHYELLENLVEEVAKDLLATFDIESIEIKLSKPGAVPEARNVGVRIRREKQV
jgi:dihydroneopterin aldolase